MIPALGHNLRMCVNRLPLRFASGLWALVLAAALGLGGCGRAPEGLAVGSDTAAQQGAVPLRVWTRSSKDSRQTYDAIAQAFTARTGIRVEYFNATTDFEQRLARAAVGRDLPDLLINDAGSLGQLHRMGVLRPIERSRILGAEHITERAWRAASLPDGRVLGVPTSAQAHVLFVRKDWREKLGLPPPGNWDEVAALAKAFTTADPDGNGRADTYGFVFPGSTARGYAAWFISSFLFQAGGEFVTLRPDGKAQAALDSAAALQTLRFFRRLVCEDRSVQPGAINADTQEANRAFISGQAGIYLSGPYHIALFDREPGRAKVEVLPAPAGPQGQRATLAGGELAYVTRTTRRAEDALKFIEFLISPEGQRLGMRPSAPADGGRPGLPVVRLPVNQLVDASATHADPRWNVVADSYAQFGRVLPMVPNWSKLQQTAAEGFNRALARCETDLRAELRLTNVQLNAGLQQQGLLAP